METSSRHMSVLESGVVFGFAASFLLAIVEIIGANALGLGAITPLRWASTVILGEGGITQPMPFVAIVLFAAVPHMLLTTLHGVLYCGLMRATGLNHKLTPLGFLLSGVLYGAFVWFFNFQIFGVTLLPWFLEVGQLPQLLAHMFAFGAPLGLFFGLSERADFRARQRETLPA